MSNNSALFNQFSATIPSGGTLSSTIDSEGWIIGGLMIVPSGTAVLAGSLGVQVSVDSTNFYALSDLPGANIFIPHGTAAAAYSGVSLQMIAPYRFWRFVDSVVQPTGMRIIVPVKQ